MKKEKVEKSNTSDWPGKIITNNDQQVLPVYPASEDIYIKFKKEENIDPAEISDIKESGNKDDIINENNFNKDSPRDNLDIPGAELDDDQENIGNEDEENNYYSLGGDNHNDLEEDKEV